MTGERENSAPRVALVTGATGAIGQAIAWQIAEIHEYEVVLACRNEKKAKTIVEKIKKKSGNNNVCFQLVDLSRRASIEELANRWEGPLHLLVNNAVIAPRKRTETPEGLELQFATNVLGYFWMMESFLEPLRLGSPSRIVNVASYWAGDLDIDDLQFKRRPYNNDRAYRQSKQANRMLTVAFAGRFKPYDIAVNVCHPGDVNSTVSNDLGYGGHESPDQGAQTPAWLATSPVGRENTGKYFEHMKESRCSFSKNKKEVEKLYQACLAFAQS